MPQNLPGTIRSNTEKFLHNYFASMQPASLYEPIRYVLGGGGKRLRPILTVLAAESVAKTDIYESALQAGAAIEILHNFTLVHDDIMDKSDMRRGRQTVHNRWSEATAILSGDTMLGAAYKILFDATANLTSFSDIMQSFTSGLIGVCEGQALDLDYQRATAVSMERYMKMIEMKTAKLLEICTEIGALIGGALPEQINALRKFARNVGIAFQIQDDLLDLAGEEAEFGKPIGNDIIEGKKTYLIVRTAEINPGGTDGELLRRFFDEQGLPAAEVPRIADMLQRRGVLDDARAAIEKFAADAARCLSALPDSPAKETLLGINAGLIVRRS